MITFIVVAIAVVVIGTIARLQWIKRQATKKATESVQDMMTVWALQGPFHFGVQSFEAMRNAYLAVNGMGSLAGMSKYFEDHSKAFDANPKAWEKSRQLALGGTSPRTNSYMEKVKLLSKHESEVSPILDRSGEAIRRRFQRIIR